MGDIAPATARVLARRMRNTHLITFLLTAVALPCPSLPAAIWIGTGDGWSWSDPSNWEEGILPQAGETAVIRPAGSAGAVEIGGAVGGGAIRLVIESPNNLSLMMNPEAKVDGVRTVGAGWHQLSGTIEAISLLEVDHGGQLALGMMATGAWLEKRGGGTLFLGSGASGAGALRLSGWEGSVTLEVDRPDALADATLDARGASFSFAGEVAGARKLVIGEGNFSQMSAGRLIADEVVIHRTGVLDLSYLPGITTDLLNITSGGARLYGSLETPHIRVIGSTLEMGESVVGGLVEVAGSWLDGGVITGTLALDPAGGMSGWSGAARMETGSRLVWKPTEDETAGFYVFGDVEFADGSLLAIGEADWENPFWDQARTFAFIDSWGDGVVRGVPQMEDGAIEGRGWWSVGADEQGGLALMWSPEVAPVPEASTLGWVAAMAIAAVSLRLGSRRGKGALAAGREVSACEAATHTGDNPLSVSVGHA